MNGLHLIDSPVTGLAPHSIVDMDLVAEMGIVGKMMDLDPLNRLTGRPTLPHGEQFGGIGPDLAVTVHAGLRWRNVRMIGRGHVGVTVLTIDIELSGVKPMAVLNRLFGSVSDVGVSRREIIPDEQDHKNRTGHGSE